MSDTERVVYKYRIDRDNEVPIRGSNPIPRHVAEVDGVSYMWVEHDTAGESTLDVRGLPTGTATVIDYPFVGTLLLNGGRLVFHIYAKQVA